MFSQSFVQTYFFSNNLDYCFSSPRFDNDNDDNDDDDNEIYKEDNADGDYQYHDNGDHRNGRVDDESDDAF